jgi:hypothetical protein
MYALEDRIHDLLGPSRSRGVNQDFRCVVHEERNASMSVNLETGLWFCHSCGAKGNYERLRRIQGAGPDADYKWQSAINRAREEVVEPPDLRDILCTSKKWGTMARDFCSSRGISRGSLEDYEVVESVGRLAFPYIDTEGRVTGIKYRYPDGRKSAEPGSEFGIFGVVLASGNDSVIICEGESDTLRVHTEVGGRVGVCGTSGAAVSAAQWTIFGVSLLFTSHIYLAYDADAAGDKCSEVAMSVLGDDRCVRMRPTRGKDLSDHLMAGGTLRECLSESSTSRGR